MQESDARLLTHGKCRSSEEAKSRVSVGLKLGKSQKSERYNFVEVKKVFLTLRKVEVKVLSGVGWNLKGMRKTQKRPKFFWKKPCLKQLL